MRQESLGDTEQNAPDQEGTYLNRGAWWFIVELDVWMMLVIFFCSFVCMCSSRSLPLYTLLLYSKLCIFIFRISFLLFLLNANCVHRCECGVVQQSGCRTHHRRRAHETGIVICFCAVLIMLSVFLHVIFSSLKLYHEWGLCTDCWCCRWPLSEF